MLIRKYASASPAILTSGQEAGYHDVFPNTTSLSLLSGPHQWNDLAFKALEKPLVSAYRGSMVPKCRRC